jgi:hypothetical protein
MILYLTPLVCFEIHREIQTHYSAQAVRSEFSYIVLFMAVWAIALLVVTNWANFLGVRALEDGIERNNGATVWGVAGAWLGATLCSGGANIGEGDTIYTTLFTLALALGAWAGLWLVFSVFTGNARSISVERDSASGLRLAGLLTAWGLILGRAVAGNWVSVQSTFHDFVIDGLPSVVLLCAASAAELGLRPSRLILNPSVWTSGVVPGFLYVVGASLWLAYLGLIR